VRLELIGTPTALLLAYPNASHVQSFAKRCSRQLFFLGPANLNRLAPLAFTTTSDLSFSKDIPTNKQLETRDITDRDRKTPSTYLTYLPQILADKRAPDCSSIAAESPSDRT